MSAEGSARRADGVLLRPKAGASPALSFEHTRAQLEVWRDGVGFTSCAGAWDETAFAFEFKCDPILAPPGGVLPIQLSLRGHQHLPVRVQLNSKSVLDCGAGSRGVVHDVEVAMLPTTTRRVVVTDWLGTRQANAQIYVFPMEGDTIICASVAGMATGGDGVAYAEFPTRSRAFLVATLYPHAPAGRVVAQGNSDVTVALDRGYRLDGTASIEGEAVHPGTVLWTYESDDPDDVPLSVKSWDSAFGVPAPDFVLTGSGRVVEKSGSQLLDSTGTFLIQGLAAGSYTLTVEADADFSPQHYSALRAVAEPPLDPLEYSVAHVHCPGSWVRLAYQCAWLRIIPIASQPGIVPSGVVRLAHDASVREYAFKNIDEAIRLPLAPKQAYVLRIESDDVRSDTVHFQAPESGSEIAVPVVLREAALGSVTVTIDGSGSMGSAWIEARTGEGDRKSDRVLALHCSPNSLGNYHIQLPEGRWHLRIWPGRSSWGAGPRPWPALNTTVHVRRNQTATANLTAVPWGLIEVRCRTAGGLPVPARVRLQSASGEFLPVKLVVPQGQWWTGIEDRLSPEGTGWLRDPVPPGEYIVHMDHSGFHPAHAPVLVEAGTCCTARATLVPDR